MPRTSVSYGALEASSGPVHVRLLLHIGLYFHGSDNTCPLQIVKSRLNFSIPPFVSAGLKCAKRKMPLIPNLYLSNLIVTPF